MVKYPTKTVNGAKCTDNSIDKSISEPFNNQIMDYQDWVLAHTPGRNDGESRQDAYMRLVYAAVKNNPAVDVTGLKRSLGGVYGFTVSYYHELLRLYGYAVNHDRNDLYLAADGLPMLYYHGTSKHPNEWVGEKCNTPIFFTTEYSSAKYWGSNMQGFNHTNSSYVVFSFLTYNSKLELYDEDFLQNTEQSQMNNYIFPYFVKSSSDLCIAHKLHDINGSDDIALIKNKNQMIILRIEKFD
jgi:hypothetical protein